MGPKKSRKNVRKMEIPTDTPTEFELGRKRTDRGEGETDTEGGGEASQTVIQCQSRRRKGYATNTYLTDLDEENIVDFVKAHEVFYKTHEMFKACSSNLSVKVYKTWSES